MHYSALCVKGDLFDINWEFFKACVRQHKTFLNSDGQESMNNLSVYSLREASVTIWHTTQSAGRPGG